MESLIRFGKYTSRAPASSNAPILLTRAQLEDALGVPVFG